jgi:hypothetical protein
MLHDEYGTPPDSVTFDDIYAERVIKKIGEQSDAALKLAQAKQTRMEEAAAEEARRKQEALYEEQRRHAEAAARLMIDVPTRVPLPSATIDAFLQSDIKIEKPGEDKPHLVYEFTLEDYVRGLDASAISIFSFAQFFANFPTKTIVVTYRDNKPSFTIQDRAEHIPVDVPTLISNTQRSVHQPVEFAAVSRLVYEVIADCNRDSVGAFDVCVTHYEIQYAASTISIIISIKSADRLDIDLSMFCAKIEPIVQQSRIRRINNYGQEVVVPIDHPPQYVSLIKYARITPEGITLFFPQHVPNNKRKADSMK